jgi:predicted phage terminase large subunit-like protein
VSEIDVLDVEDFTDEEIEGYVDSLAPDERSAFLRRLKAAQRGRPLRAKSSARMEPKPSGVSESFVDFTNRVAPAFAWHRHLRRWAAALQLVADGKVRRLLLGAPPRNVKSSLLQLFAAYYLSRDPTRWVGSCSYGAKLAEKNATAARDHYLSSGAKLDGAKAAMNEWHTGQGGGHWAAGMGGSMIGFGFDLGIIDDPLSGPEDCFSDAVIEGNWNFYQGKFLNRQNDANTSAIIVAHQRWPGRADLIGRILELEKESASPERWTVILDSALKIAEPPELPPTCIYLDDDRAEGEPLFPMKFSRDALLAMRDTVGSLWFDAQQQQRPSTRKGRQFQWDWFDVVDTSPVVAERVRYWDTAGTEGGGDFTAGVLIARDARGVYTVEDVVRGQWGAGRRNQTMRETASTDRKKHGRVTQWVEVPTGQGAKEAAADIVRSLEGFDVQTEHASDKPKPLRAEGLAASAKAGNIKVLRNPAWNTTFLTELADFGPGCTHDDQVDGASGAYNKLAERAGRVWRTSHVSF